MNKQLADDLFLSHAFLNALTASYQGLYVYLSTLEQLTPSAENRNAMAKTAGTLEMFNGWWDEFKAHKPLVRHSGRPPLSGDAGSAWRLLGSARQRIASLVDQLAATTNLEHLMSSRRAVYIRAAADSEAAYSRQHFIQGLITYGQVMKQMDVADRWLQHTLSSQQGVKEADALVAMVQQLNGQFVPHTIADVLDRTLVLHVIFAQRLVDIARIFTLCSNDLRYTEVGILSREAKHWADRGIAPYMAGQWLATGIGAEGAVAWVASGIADPLAAANFKLRGFDAAAARQWWENGFPGRFAAAWREAGCGVEEAAAWKKRGIGHPSMVRQPA